ncbi:MAG TPA: glycosyltransferase family A protein [Elusimicrobiota bacterium]|nr:glycosyltransferase family A protein [Elusimicrobiota bacterium]
MLPLISVVVPVYNREKYVIQALKSVERQGYAPLEVLVIDDGSVDRSLRRIQGRSWKFPLRILKLRRSAGPSVARRVGIKNALGTWIAFLDADDRWHPDKLSELMSRRTASTRFLFSDASLVSGAGKVLARKAMKKLQTRAYRKKIRSLWGVPFFPLTSTVLVERRFLERAGSFDPQFRHVAEDVDVWFRLLRKLRPGGVFCSPRPLTCYRRHRGQTSYFVRSPGVTTHQLWLQKRPGGGAEKEEKSLDAAMWWLKNGRDWLALTRDL